MDDAHAELRERSGWYARLDGERGGGGLPLNSTSNALEASRVVKAGAGTLYGLSGYSNKGAAQFVLVFDASAVPSNGAKPIIVINVPGPPWNFSGDFGFFGRSFDQGIVVCNSSTAATLTIGSADTWFDVQYV